jgi:hypothetical protein
VRASVEKGIKFLESDAAVDSLDRVGARAIQGYSLLVFGAEHTHPKIVAAADKIHAALGARDLAKVDTAAWDVYSTGLSIIFLVKLDPQKYHSDIEFLLAYLHKRQKPHGGWGYLERETGDTSMTQYGVLSSWTAKNAGFNVPYESIESVATWLLKTQDPSGGFGYQGNISTTGAPVAQSEVRPSMTAAGSGSLYICASFLGMIDPKDKDDKVPSAMKEVKEKEPAKERIHTRIEMRLVRDTETRANAWLEAHGKVAESEQWVHYYLYALERCMSFREHFEHKTEKEPKWYNEGAEFLMKSQTPAGSWNGQCGAVADTAFGVLFLMRSTQRAIEPTVTYKEGVMIGGHGIPKDTSRIERDHNGQLKEKPLLGGSAQGLLDALDHPDTRDFDKKVEQFAELPDDQIEKLATKYGDKIRALVRNKSQDARLAAVKALGKQPRNLDNVETLIYALTDPDPLVVRAANDSLQRIRRVPVVTPLAENLSDEDRRLLVEKWKAWYQTIRPSAEVKY